MEQTCARAVAVGIPAVAFMLEINTSGPLQREIVR